MRLELCDNVTPEKLIKAGFKQQSDNKMIFRIREKLYEDSIYFMLKIDLSSEAELPITWNVFNMNSGSTYNTFYFSPNTRMGLVCETVHKNFDEVVNELEKREILYRRFGNV